MATQLPLFDASKVTGKLAGRRPPGGQLFDTSPYEAPKAAPAPTGAHHHISSDQLQMFMTPREITSKYQVLDGDRQTDEWGRAGSITGRSRDTAGSANERWMGPTGNPSYRRFLRDESDEQVHARKLEESQMDPDEYHEWHHGDARPQPGPETMLDRSSAPQWQGSNSSAVDRYDMAADSYLGRKLDEHYSEPSLYESIQESGVQSPVHLGRQFGSQGKPMIVGGHHRIAAAHDIAPDQPIPVLHHENLQAARSTGYKYT